MITHRKMEGYNEIYPQLPDDTEQTGEKNFRLKQSSEWLANLEKELDARKNIYKKLQACKESLFERINLQWHHICGFECRRPWHRND